MKRKVFFLSGLILNLAFMSIFVSCDNENGNEGNETDILKNTISAKWEISDNDSPYASFEFNKDGNYIVIEKDEEISLKSNLRTNSKQSLLKSNLTKTNMRSAKSDSNLSSIHFGTYKIEGNSIILSGFGLIEVISITNEEFSFSFTLESTREKSSFVAGKADEPISSSSKTDMFCRTWIGEKVTIDVNALSVEDIGYYEEKYGEDWLIKLEQEETEDIKGLVALFSKAGTYLVLYDGEEGDAGLAEWKWANKEETKIYYSWENWQEDWEDNIVTIELTNTSLIIHEKRWVYHMILKN
jgi:hypothetical protein